MTNQFIFESFVGLHILLVIADLIFNVILKFFENVELNIIDPLFEAYFKDLYEIKLNMKSKIKVGSFIYGLIKSLFNVMLIFTIYKYTLKYKKYQSLKLT